MKRNTFEEDPEAIPLCFVEPDPVSDADRLIPVDLVTGRLLTNCLLQIRTQFHSVAATDPQLGGISRSGDSRILAFCRKPPA